MQNLVRNYILLSKYSIQENEITNTFGNLPYNHKNKF